MSSKISKWNQWWVGWIAGIILPLVGLLVMYLFDSSYHSLKNFILMSYQLGVMSNILSLSLLANLAGFYFFLNREWYYAVRGVIFAVLTWGSVILYFRFTIPHM